MAAALAVICAAGPVAPRADTPPPAGPPPGPAPPLTANAPIIAPALPPEPAAGKGRLSLRFGGNRQWCTFPDDRIVRPPARPSGRKGARSEVFTFGYKFIVSAVRRGAPETPLMLFESPLYKTASWRPAAKVGIGASQGVTGPRILSGEPGQKPAPPGPSASTLVPYWQEEFRCTTLAERFEFDLEPGTYDVYIAFDLLLRQGTWVHRMADYLTDVPLEAGRTTLLQGLVNLGAGSEREVALLRSTLGAADEPPGAGGP